ncbi:N-acetyltransferase [Fulvivirga sp. RKSG066]|uniref:GNAT family N-acetyltransferase n=1 Tax=Fulvivirga aurantia TaxID=2529383 RepID=UPI0012BBECC6|nr:GNAT family N-acetyltransferase [Fulvivirga aurantia]MTI21215.1 N-acetyltransferase [Fulvivirga aurantia]
MYQFLEKLDLSDNQKNAIIDLWNNGFPVGIRHPDLNSFNKYLNSLSNHRHVIVIDGDKIKGWYSDFIRQDERWFSMILASDIQGRGVGSKLLNMAKTKNRVLNGWVVDRDNYSTASGLPYKPPVKFYLKNGFKLIAEERLELKELSAVKIQWIAK